MHKPVHRCQGCGRTLGHDPDCTTYRDWGKEPDPAPDDPADTTRDPELP